MQYGLLGPFEVTGADVSAAGVRPGKPAALLALLLLERNRAIAVDRLIDGLWGDRPPQTARKTLQLYVSQLRKALPEGVLETKGGGYILHVAPGEVDIDRFVELAEAGRAAAESEHEAASRALGEALALWRGPALADFEYEQFAQQEIRRLDELRLAVLAERIDADLALGRQARLVPELERLVEGNPTREHFRAQLMLALYRCGRQADALAVYREGRRVLDDELGIEPGTELRELERAILEHDPRLGALIPVEHTPRRRRFRGRYAYLAAAGAVAVAVVAWMLAGRSPASNASTAANTAVALGADGGPVTSMPVGASPRHLLRDGDMVWTSNEQDDTVSRIDPRSRSIDTFAAGRSPEGMAVANGDLWVALAGDGKLVAFDVRSGTPVSATPVGNGPVDVAARGNRLWVADSVDGTIVTVSAFSRRRIRTTPVGAQPTAVLADRNAVWVALAGSGSVVELDRNGVAPLQTVNVGNDPVALAEGAGSIWVANREGGTVTQIDPENGNVEQTKPVGGSPTGIAVAGDTVWVTLAEGQVVRIDARTGDVLGRTAVSGSPAAVAAGKQTWVTLLAQPQQHRGGTLRVESYPIFDNCDTCADPLDVYSPDGWEVLPLLYDGLVTYRPTSGPAGAALVADLAQSVPKPSADGRTYVFRLRPGVHFSNGRLVRPSDVRASFVRFFMTAGQRDDFSPITFDQLAGAAACSGEDHRCSALGVIADDRTGTITFHLSSPDPNFLYELALPPASVLPSSLGHGIAHTAPPGTGAYEVDSYRAPVGSTKPGRLVLTRNPHYESRDGAVALPDRIVVDLDQSSDRQVARVERGDADVVSSDLYPPSLVHDLATRYPSQIHVDPEGRTDFMFLNTRVPPFDRLDARRAVNDAVDRSLLVRLLGGHDVASPTCQVLPPAFPGYRPYCPYGVAPSAAGTWTGPNLERAAALVAASGTRGERVRVWAPLRHANVARYFASVLDRIGYRASVRIVPPGKACHSCAYYNAIGRATTRAQIGWAGWIKDYPWPADFIPTLFGCSGISRTPADTTDYSRFCNPSLEQAIAGAESVQQVDAVAGQAAWARADRLVVDAAASVPYANDLMLTLLSHRTGNYQFNPEWGVLLDQLWVR